MSLPPDTAPRGAIALEIPAALRQGLAALDPMPLTALPSPCISVCRMDAASGLCAGCLRTRDELAAWSRLDDQGKRSIWARIARRVDATGA